jgi:hypothetical protein
VSGDFAAAVRAFVKGSFDRASDLDRRVRDAGLRWFACEKVPELKEHGVLAQITSKNARQTLRNFIGLLHGLGYKGMAFFIDEIENLLTRGRLGYTPAQRQIAYQNLRELLDNIDGGVSGVGLNRAVCYIAATPIMFTGEHGFREYAALHGRIDEVRVPIAELHGLLDYRAVIIDLAASSLEAVHRRKLAEKIRNVHAVAYSWDPKAFVTDSWLDTVAAEYEKHKAEQGGLRPLCRTLANALDLAEQHRHQLTTPEATQLVSRAYREEPRP